MGISVSSKALFLGSAYGSGAVVQGILKYDTGTQYPVCPLRLDETC